MLALIALSSAFVIWTCCGLVAHRRPEMRLPAFLLGTGGSLLVAATFSAHVAPDAPFSALLVVATLVLLMAASQQAVQGHVKFNGTIGEWLEAAFVLGATTFCGWELILRPLDTADPPLQILALTVILAISVILLQFALTRSSTPYIVLIPVVAVLGVIALGISRDALTVRMMTYVGWAHSLWFAVAAGSLAITLLAALGLWPSSGRSWAFAQKFRNTLLVESAAIVIILVAGISVVTRKDGELTSLIALPVLATLFIARLIRAYVTIVRLEASVSARSAIIRLPGQAASVRSAADFNALLSQLASAAASLLRMNRAEIRLDDFDTILPVPALVTWGLTDVESELLGRHPRVEATLADRAPGDFQPFVLFSSDRLLPVAAQQAWTVAGKTEALIIPLHAGSRALGHIELWSPSQAIEMTPAVMAIATDFGAEAGLMIEHGQLSWASSGDIIEAEMLLATSEVFARATSLTECLPIVAERLLKMAASDRITISLIDHAAGEVLIAADARSLATGAVPIQGKRWPLHLWVSYDELRKHRTALVVSRTDAQAPERIVRLMEIHGAQSYLAIPGYSEDRLTSIVQIMAQTNILQDSPEICKIWKSIATQIQLGIESVKALEASQRRGHLESVRRQINEALQNNGNLQDAYETVADIFRSIPHVDGVTILSWHPEREHYVVEAEWTIPPIPCLPVGTVHSKDQYLLLEELSAETRPRMRWIGQRDLSDEQRSRLVNYHLGAAMAMPLRIEDRLVGAMMVYSIEQRAFLTETVEWVDQLAGTLALVVKTMGLRRRDDELREEQMLKLRMLQAATSRSDPTEALHAIADAGIGYAGAESINIAFIDAEAREMTIAADCTVADWPGVEEPGTVLAVEPGSIQERSFTSLQPMMFRSDQSHLGEWDRLDIEVYGANAWIAAPLSVGGMGLGLLQVLSRDPNAFDDRRLRLWHEVAQQVSLVISTLQVSFDNKRLSHQQRLISLINHAGATASTQEETFRLLAQIGLQLPGVESSTVFLWHEQDHLLEIAHEAVGDESLRRYRLGQRITPGTWSEDGLALQRRKSLHFFRADPNLSDTERELLDGIGMGRASIFMLLDEGDVNGVLVLKSRAPAPFPEETLRLAEAIAAAIAAVLRNVRSRSEERRTEREQQALLRLSRAATRCSSLDDLLRGVAATVRSLCGADCCEMFTFGPDNRTELSAISAEPQWRSLAVVGTSWPTGYWPVEELLRESLEPVVILDWNDPRVSESMRAELARRDIRSLALIPLPQDDGIRGYVAVYAGETRRFTTHSVLSTAAVVNQVTLAIDHARTRIEEMRVAEQRALLLRVSQAAGSSLDLRAVLSEIANATLGVAHSESCVIELYDPDTDELVLHAVSRIDDWVIPEEMIGKRRPFGSWAIDAQLRAEGSVIVDSVDDPRAAGMMRADMLKYQTNSIVAHSLVGGGNFIGMCYCFGRQVAAYRPQDQWVVGEIAAHIVSAVQNARMLEHEQQVGNERARLLQITEAATRSLDLTQVLDEIASAMIGLAGAESCRIELVDYQQNEFVTQAFAYIPEWHGMNGIVVGSRNRIGSWLIDRECIEINAPISIGSLDDVRVVGKMREDMLVYGAHSVLLIPIWLSDHCVGMLSIYSRKPNAFSNAQQTIAHTLATNAANAIQNAQTHERERMRRRNQEALLQLTAAATSSLNVYEAMHHVCIALCQVMDSESANVGILHPELEVFEVAADVTAGDWNYADEPGTFLPASEFPFVQRMTSSRSAFLASRRSGSPEQRRYIEQGTGSLESYVLAPLWLNDVCLGYMGLYDRRPDHFDQAVLDLMDSAGPLIALALSNGLTSRDQQRRAADRAAVVNVGRAAVSEAEVTQKLQLIGQACLDIHRVDGVSIYQWEAESNELVCMAAVGQEVWPYPSAIGHRFAVPSDSPLRPFIDSREASSFSLADVTLLPHLRAGMEATRGETSAIFPLRVDDQLIGLAAFHSQQAYAFDEEMHRVGREVATQTALAIRASRLLETTRRYSNEQSALLAVNRAVMNATQSSIEEVLQSISHETMMLIGAECCEIEGVTEDLDATILLAQVFSGDWRNNASGTGVQLPLCDWPSTQRVMDQQRPLMFETEQNDLTEAEQAILLGCGTQSGLIAPMVLNGRSVGTITFYSREHHAFSRDQARLAMEFGSLAGLAIDRARTNMALAEQATIDGLTGVLNHRAFLERLDQHISIAERTNDTVAMLMIDFDWFKRINDVHGHLAGDTVLRETAKFLKQTLRASDLVARYGGDEFAVILPNSDAVHAAGLRDRLLEMGATHRVTLADGSIVVPSFSIGIAAYPAQASDRQSLIEAADRSMYESKNGALNAVSRAVAFADEESTVQLSG